MTTQQIGKYRVIERIGRGGMGTIVKAYDPVLDRLVALKVISPEVEVTDELRTRFFREAQACAKLNHPNIVTIFDLGEDDGRLFIVMELLEGQELRRLISQRSPLTLEEKLSVMVQACGGLYYAHEKGIVHRDIKPSNIFLLTNGQVKILDFGIAQMASTEGGLTRTGLIMGTLRYISPEQVRGRVDHRSDMFSLGTVFYELLSLRPAFTGDDPMQLLEQLRSEDPPLLADLDASIPPKLAGIVQRAISKDPADRFRDLGEMRFELQLAHRHLDEERHRVTLRLHTMREKLLQLQVALDRYVEGSVDDASVAPIDEGKGLLAVQALERELADRIGEAEAKLARAESAAPVVERADALLDAGRITEAIVQFEAVLVDVPDHSRAREGLDDARSQSDARRRRQLGAALREKAQAALTERRYAVCLQILDEAANLSLPDGLAAELAALRQTALTAQEALRLARRQADEAARHVATERAGAEAVEAPQFAVALWNEAEALAAAAKASLGQEAYAEAEQGFDQALAAYRRATQAARQIQAERQSAERARDAATHAQQEALAADGPQYAGELWTEAEALFGEAQAVFAGNATGFGRALFTEASGLYRRAESLAREARERDRRRAESARDRAVEGRRTAAELDAERRVPSAWQEAVAKSTAGEAALSQHQYGHAAEAFEASLTVYQQAHAEARELARQQREASERTLAEARARESLRAGDDAESREFERLLAEARRFLESMNPAACLARVQACLALRPDHAGAAALRAEAEAGLRRVDETTLYVRGSAPHGDETTIVAHETMVVPPGPPPAVEPPSPPLDADETIARTGATTRFGTTMYAPPESDLGTVISRRSPEPVAEAEPAVEPAWRRYLTLRNVGIGAGALATLVAVTFWWSQPRTARVAEGPPKTEQSTPSPPPTEAARGKVEAPREEAPKAGAGKRVESTERVTEPGLPPRVREGGPERAAGRAPDQDASERERDGMVTARQSAERAGAPRLAAQTFAAAQRTDTAGDASFKRREFASAKQRFLEAQKGYKRAADEAEHATATSERQQAEQSRTLMVDARNASEQAGADRHAPRLLASAQAKEREGNAAFGRSDYAGAGRSFRDAQAEYQTAARDAKTGAERDQAIAVQRQHAEQIRAQMHDARNASDQAGAERHVPRLLASAQAKEREGVAAFSRADYNGAARSFDEARTEYQTAMVEGRKRATELDGSRRAMEQSRGRMLTRREDAVKAEAPRLAKDTFDAAVKRQAEADALSGRQNFASADQAYHDAEDLYVNARSRARDATEARSRADRARTQMQAEKRRANSAAPEYGRAEAEEGRANALYERASFDEAAERYRSVETLYAAAKIAPDPPKEAPSPKPPPEPSRTKTFRPPPPF